MSDTPSTPPQSRRERREREAAGVVPVIVPVVVPVANPVAAAVVAPAAALPAAPVVAQDTVPVQSLPKVEIDFSTWSGHDVSPALAMPPRALAEPVAKNATKKKAPKKSFSARVFPAFAMLFAGALLVGVSVPANAFIEPEQFGLMTSSITTDLGSQSIEVSAEAKSSTIKRDLPTVTSYASLLAERYGNISYTYEATTGAVRWPFGYPVPISDGYGTRVAPCRGCSTQHRGVDFTPGDGTPISAIAKGTVVFTEVTMGGIGNQVQVEHTINGQKVTSVYAGMQMNSSPLKVGDEVAVGDFIGLVGMTGVATGPHLHFELLLDGVHTDPFAWLKANATNKD